MKASEPLSRRCCGRDYMPVAERCEKSWAGERCALTARLAGQAQAKKAAAQRGTSLNSRLPRFYFGCAGIAARSLTAAKEKF
jgi:hypothetical protein